MESGSPFNDELRVITPASECSYLPDETSSLDFRVIPQLTDEEYDQLLALGWRRHGLHIFRPACPNCQKCRSLRVSVADFRPSKSQRRVIRKNPDVQLFVQPPSLSQEHLDLFNRYHAAMHKEKGWPHKETNGQDYFESFLCGNYSFEREFLYFADQKLVAVGLVDVTAISASSIYFYHDPDWRPRSLGTFSMLSEIEFLKQQGTSYHYLGYWIQECASMAYKDRFRPHEILESYVQDHEIPVWKLNADN